MESITWFLHVLFIWHTGMADSLKASAFICNKFSIRSENRTFQAMAPGFLEPFLSPPPNIKCFSSEQFYITILQLLV